MRKFLALITGLALIFSGVIAPHDAQAYPSENPEKKISSDVSTAKGKRVSVIVEMKAAPVTVYDEKSNAVKSRYQDEIEKKQKDLMDEMKKVSPDIQVGETYDTVFSGMEVKIDGADLKKLSELPDVKHIYPVRTYQTNMKGSAPLIGAPDAWKQKDSRGQALTGKGMKVAVIDTGVDATHPDLKKNVIGGYDFVDKDETPQDGDGHGTHVAGTIAANGKIKGVAPEASILAYRVLDDNGMGDTADILAAVDQAVKDEADVMNLSLGMDVNVPDEPLSWALERAVKNGVVAVVANGNAGPRRWTAGSPAASSHVISVGASTKKDPVPVVQAVGDSMKVELNEISFSPQIPLKGTYPIVDAGTGKTSELKHAKGKVALVQRTGNDVNGLAKRAKKAGAAAVMVYNDKGGDWFADILMPGMDHEGNLDNSMFAPIGTLTNKHGLHLKKQVETGKTQVRFSSVKREKMTDFSSRGPAAGNWEVKPDVVAPGHNIVSTVPQKINKSGYDSMSGTSMAAPHVAGAAALVLQKHPQWTPQEVKAAPSNTAVTLTDTEQKPYPKALQGAGRIDLMKALHTKKLALPNSLSFGLFIPGTGVQQTEKSLQIKNLDNREKTYRTRLALDKRNKGFTVEVPSTITVQPSQTASIPVTLNIDTRLPRGEYTGSLYLTDGSDEINVPFQALIDPKGYPLINNMSTSEWFISPNGDGRLDTVVLSYYLPVSPDELTITLHRDIEKKATHTIYREKQPIAGAVDWVWDGKDLKGNTVKDGEYVILATAKFLGRKGEDLSFVIVDSTPPDIQVDKPTDPLRISGKVKESNLERMHWRIEGESGWKRINFEHVERDTWKFRKLFKKDELKKGKNQVTMRDRCGG